MEHRQSSLRLTLVALASIAMHVQIAVTSAKADELDMQIRQKITSPDQHERDLSWITPELRPQILVRLKQRLEDPLRRETAEDGLLTLNDSETVERLIKQYHEGDHNAASQLRLCGREEVVSRLIEDVIKGPGPKLFGGSDVIAVSQQDYSTGIILNSMVRSTAFPPATKLWASHARDMFSTPFSDVHRQVYGQIQAWWTNNKDAILAGKFQSATWLPEEKIVVTLPGRKKPTEDPKRTPAPKPAEKPGVPPPPATEDTTSTKPGVSAPLATTDKAAESTPLRGGWALWAGIAAVLAAAAGWLLLRSKRKG